MQENLGSTYGTSDSGGNSASTPRFFPFGVCRFSQGTIPTDEKFTGQRLDQTGLYYYNARYYDATIGRFISADTIIPNAADPQSFNRYSYVLNNPLKYTDPSGRLMWLGDDAASSPIGDTPDITHYADLYNPGISRNVSITPPTPLPISPKPDPFSSPLNVLKSLWNSPGVAYENTYGNKNASEEPKITPGVLPPISLNQIMNLLPVVGMVPNPESFYPEYVNLARPSTLVSYAERLEASRTVVTAKQADQLVVDCKNAGVDVRFDPGHPNTDWTDPHLNIGKGDSKHVLVDPEWNPPDWVKGH